MRGKKIRYLLPVFTVIFLMMSEMVHAQYFGRNKVKYHEPEFVVKSTPNFDIHHYTDNEEFISDAAYITERWYERLREIFGFRFSGSHPVIYYRNQEDFQQTFITLGVIGQGTRGFTEAFQQRLVMPFTGSYSSFDHIVGHEMVHVFQYKAANMYGSRGLRNLMTLPLWFIEGKAEYLSVGDMDAHTSMYLRDALLRDDLPTLRDMSRRPYDYFPYRFGHAFWVYVGTEYGDSVIAPMLFAAINNGLSHAFSSVLNTNMKDFSEKWHQEIKDAYGPYIEVKDTPGMHGREILSPDLHAGRMNLAPAISPDGNQVVFFSEKDLFATELFLADANTGEINKRLTRSVSNRHFESLNFMESGGAWSPDGRRIALTVSEKGEQKIAVINARTGRLEQKITIDEVDEVSTPFWSPDGNKIVFSGMKGGWTNLYIVDSRSGETEQLTSGRNADTHPTWSPDGEIIAFSTDRGYRTDFTRLVYGPKQIAFYYVETGEIDLLPLFNEGKHINPRFSPDGESLYFIADHDGFSDIYRYENSSGQIYRVTNYATGVSGITEASPAMSIAANTGDLMYSVFDASEYIVYRLDAAHAQGELYEESDLPSVSKLPPFRPYKGREIVNDYLDQPDAEQDPGATHPVSEYQPSLILDYIGQGGIGAGMGGPYGGGVSGAITAYFSDILGDHRLTVGAFMQGNQIEDLGLQALYQNFENRWQWGVLASRIPIVSGSFYQATIDNRPADVLEITRMNIHDADFIVQYPFSQTLRFETGLGYSQYRFSREVQIYYWDGDRDRQQLPSPSPPLHFFNSNVALVGDNSFFGFTSPVKGWRYRFGMRPTIGSRQFYTGIADMRYYHFINPITLATRGYYAGRYGPDRETDIIRDFFLGTEFLFQYFVRGYSPGSFTREECPEGGANCAEYQRLFGSQMIATNFELRLPLLGTDQFGLINFPYVPTELSGFFDAGLAWSSEESPSIEFTRDSDKTAIPVMSTGISSRFNILGAIIIELNYAYPFQRPEKGWHFGFSLMPGW